MKCILFKKNNNCFLFIDGPLPSVLQEVTVPVINNSVCETMYRAAGYIEHIPDIFICAGWKKGGFDSCEVRITPIYSLNSLKNIKINLYKFKIIFRA